MVVLLPTSVLNKYTSKGSLIFRKAYYRNKLDNIKILINNRVRKGEGQCQRVGVNILNL